MLVLNDTNELRIQLTESAVSGQIHTHCVYADADHNNNTFNESSHQDSSNGTNYHTILTAPALGVNRIVKEMYLFNADTVEHGFIMWVSYSGSSYAIFRETLKPGETFTFNKKYSSKIESNLLVLGMSSQQTPSGVEIVVAFNQIIHPNDDFFSISGGRMTAKRKLKALVDYGVTLQLDSNDTSRNTLLSYLKKNGSRLNYSDGACYARGYGYDKFAVANASGIYIDFAANDYLELAVIRDDDIQTPTIGNSKTWITVKNL